MAFDPISLALSKGYTEETVEGLGALQGEPGKDATINGENTLQIVAGENVSIEQQDGTLTISATGGGPSLPTGGTTNQVLAKASDADGDVKWADQSGGTGGGTVQWEDINGRPDLSTVSSMKTAPIVLNALLWDESNKQTIPVEGVVADEEQQLVIAKPKRTSRALFKSCGVELVDQEDGALVFDCETVPEANISVNAFIFSAAEVGQEYAGNFVWWSPEMTSDNTPEPYVASASSVYSIKSAYHAFNSTSASWWASFTDTDKWIQFDFGTDTVIKGIKIFPDQGSTSYIAASPNKFDILGSHDGENWVNIISEDYEGVPPAEGEWREIEFNPVNYRYYRLANLLCLQVTEQYMFIQSIMFYKLEYSQ